MYIHAVSIHTHDHACTFVSALYDRRHARLLGPHRGTDAGSSPCSHPLSPDWANVCGCTRLFPHPLFSDFLSARPFLLLPQVGIGLARRTIGTSPSSRSRGQPQALSRGRGQVIRKWSRSSITRRITATIPRRWPGSALNSCDQTCPAVMISREATTWNRCGSPPWREQYRHDSRISIHALRTTA